MIQIKEATTNSEWRLAYKEKLDNPNLPYTIVRLTIDGKLIGSMHWDSRNKQWR